jgi:hypothetical protein
MATATIQDGRNCVNWDSSVTFYNVECGCCGGLYAILERHRKWCEEHSKSWSCPYCKVTWGYDHDGSPLNKARRRINRLEATERRLKDERDTAERQRRGQKAAKTRLINRIKAGKCPCCGKTFPDLHKHMSDKHPDYGQLP